jgi:hypothetical protein
MSLLDWRAQAPSQPVSTCGPAVSSTPVYRCRMPDVPLGRYRTRGLTYTFRDGRLVGISFTASVDAFDAVVAELKRANGAPTSVRRDTIKLPDGLVFPHVRMVWRRAGSAITLRDPGPRGVQIFVDIATGAAQPSAKESVG